MGFSRNVGLMRRRCPVRSTSLIAVATMIGLLKVTVHFHSQSFLVSAFHTSSLSTCTKHQNQINLSHGRNKSFVTQLFLTTNSDGRSHGSFPRPLEPKPRSNSDIPRTIRVERMPRLPVWPVWAGVIDFFVGWIFGPEAGSKLEQYLLGGRVCPMQLDGTKTSPFLLLVHHHHNFWKWDAIFRKISGLVLPEGFPAHPHRGFTTLTYFLPEDIENISGGGGGFIHRDSIGVKQTYGSKGSYRHQAQWLFTGSGILHEEMFDFAQDDFTDKDYNSRYELYQLWVNVPAKFKLDSPRVQLLRTVDGSEDTTGTNDNSEGTMPSVQTILTSGSTTTKSNVVVIAGEYRPHNSNDIDDDDSPIYESQVHPLHSDMTILHVTITETSMKNGAESQLDASSGWTYEIPSDHDTLIIYVRKGSCAVETTTTSITGTTSTSERKQVPIHSTIFIEKPEISGASSGARREKIVMRSSQLDDPLDFLLLSGRPLYEEESFDVEPVAMQGSMVMNQNLEIQAAYRDYQLGQMGIPWDHELTDDEWTEHVRQTSMTLGRTEN